MGVSVLLLCSITQIIAQSFTAKIEDIGGYYRLSFTVSSCSASNFTPPSLSAFEVLSGPNESTFRNYQIVNGRSSSSESTTYTYILSARQSGRINIGAASVHVGGKTLRSNAISVNAKKVANKMVRTEDNKADVAVRPLTMGVCSKRVVL